MVRQVFAWVGRDRLTMGEVCRRLTQAGERTRTGRLVGERSVVGGILPNPAYQGSAAVGKRAPGPCVRVCGPSRGPPICSRDAPPPTLACPASAWLPIPVPALVDTGVFAAVQEQ